MFQEALEIARANPEGDRWAEARALVSLTSSISPHGNEEECLPLGLEALELGRKMDDPFTVAVAQENVGNSLRRMMRLDEALSSLEEAVAIFRDLGARWELASALGDRGFCHQLAGRLPDARRDLHEALEICRRLGERSLTSWTAAQLALVMLALGDVEEARRLVMDPATQASPGDVAARADLLVATAVIDLAEGDHEEARERLATVLALEEGFPVNQRAHRTWFVGLLLGADAAGGQDAVEEARKILERARWVFAFQEAELAVEAVAGRGQTVPANL
jgi:tetratricopeptide (TPR) repeat protein